MTIQCGMAREAIAGHLLEAYFLARHLASRAQRFAIVNVVRPTGSYLRVLRRLRRTRGALYVVDLLLVRLIDLVMVPIVRRQLPPGSGALPEIDAGVIERLLDRHPHIDCADPHAPEVLEFVRTFDPDYILLAGCPILKPSFYKAAYYMDESLPSNRIAAIAKFHASQTAKLCADKAMQIFGGYGLAKEYRVSWLKSYADLFFTGEGSANVQKILIAEDALGYKFADRHHGKTGLPDVRKHDLADS